MWMYTGRNRQGGYSKLGSCGEGSSNPTLLASGMTPTSHCSHHRVHPLRSCLCARASSKPRSSCVGLENRGGGRLIPCPRLSSMSRSRQSGNNGGSRRWQRKQLLRPASKTCSNCCSNPQRSAHQPRQLCRGAIDQGSAQRSHRVWT